MVILCPASLGWQAGISDQRLKYSYCLNRWFGVTANFCDYPSEKVISDQQVDLLSDQVNP